MSDYFYSLETLVRHCMWADKHPWPEFVLRSIATQDAN